MLVQCHCANLSDLINLRAHNTHTPYIYIKIVNKNHSIEKVLPDYHYYVDDVENFWGHGAILEWFSHEIALSFQVPQFSPRAYEF